MIVKKKNNSRKWSKAFIVNTTAITCSKTTAPAASVPMSEGQRSVLDIIAALTGLSITISVRDGLVVAYSEDDDLPAEDVYNYINQLQGLGYITISHKASGVGFVRVINMTIEGLRAANSSDKQELR
jgi:hypothetical protein